MPSLNSQTAYDCALGTLRDGSFNTARLETHNTNAQPQRPTIETHDTNARPQRPKTGPVTPAKATPVSQPTPTRPAKATPVSRASRHHCHHELSTARSHRSSTGSLAPICESQSMFHACFTRTDQIPTPVPRQTWPAPLDSAQRHPLARRKHPHATDHAPLSCRRHHHAHQRIHVGSLNHADGRSVRVGGVRREEWGHGR